MFKDSSHLPNKIECKDIVNISIIMAINGGIILSEQDLLDALIL